MGLGIHCACAHYCCVRVHHLPFPEYRLVVVRECVYEADS